MNLNRPSSFYAMNALSVVYLDVRIDRIVKNNDYEDKSFEKLVYVKIDENERDRKGRPSVISGHVELGIYFVNILVTTLWKHA